MIKKPHLLTPGPTPVPPEVARLGSEPLFHHRTAEFSRIYMQATEGLKYILQTTQDVFLMAASGTGAMEAAVVNLLDPGDPVLVINGGKFGDRWARLIRAYALDLREVNLSWGEAYPAQSLAERLTREPAPKAVFATLSETSTGTVFDIEGYARITREQGVLLVVDGISGLGAMPCPMDDWGIDVLIGGSQKSFMTPPGLSFVAFSPKAWEAVEGAKLPRFYFDARAARTSLFKQTSPWTPAVSLVRQLHKALALMQDWGLQELFSHHRILGDAVRAGVRALDLELLSRQPGNITTAVKIPSGMDGTRLIRLMQDKYRVHIAGAQAPHEGEFFRIGHLGFIDGFDIITALTALEMTLGDLDYVFNSGDSLRAAQAIIKEHWS